MQRLKLHARLVTPAESWSFVSQCRSPHYVGYWFHMLLKDWLHWTFDPFQAYQWNLTAVDNFSRYCPALSVWSAELKQITVALEANLHHVPSWSIYHSKAVWSLNAVVPKKEIFLLSHFLGNDQNKWTGVTETYFENSGFHPDHF